MTNKTLGRIAYEAVQIARYHRIPTPWNKLSKDRCAQWEAGADAVTTQCAEIAYKYGCANPKCEDCAGHAIAANLRKLCGGSA